MPATPHVEQHFTAGAVVRDVVIGMSDGLTVPFALAAGLTGALDASSIIVTAGLAEVAAGSIAMGLGGYLAAKSDAEHYASERVREQREVKEIPAEEIRETTEIFESYGLTPEESKRVVQALSRRPETWVDFMMRFELGLEKPDARRAARSALTIAGAYVAGGLIPLAPYLLVGSARRALPISIAVTLVALGVFGYVKGRFTGARPFRSAVQTVLIGALAAKKRKTVKPARPVRKGPETLRMRSAAPGFTVNDIQKSLAWYRDVLGFIVKERWDHEGKLAGVEMLAGSVSFMLSQDDWKKGRDRAKGEGVRIYCTTAQDVDVLAKRIKARGGTLTQEPHDEPWGMRDFALVDPDGYKITIAADKR